MESWSHGATCETLGSEKQVCRLCLGVLNCWSGNGRLQPPPCPGAVLAEGARHLWSHELGSSPSSALTGHDVLDSCSISPPLLLLSCPIGMVQSWENPAPKVGRSSVTQTWASPFTSGATYPVEVASPLWAPTPPPKASLEDAMGPSGLLQRFHELAPMYLLAHT